MRSELHLGCLEQLIEIYIQEIIQNQHENKKSEELSQNIGREDACKQILVWLKGIEEGKITFGTVWRKRNEFEKVN